MPGPGRSYALSLKKYDLALGPACNNFRSALLASTSVTALRHGRIKVGVIDAAALGPFLK